MKALYIHIPFCIKKCDYCDFVSFPGMDESTMDRYVDALCEECSARKDLLRGGISTLYFGGGTPSLLSPAQVERIFLAIRQVCPEFPSEQEVTLEVNPGTVDADKLQDYRALGINRISLGIQVFDNNLLQILGRIHTVEEALDAYGACRTANFDNISIDLMFALPCQTVADWKRTLKTAVSLKPEHLSVYNLQVEEGTPMWNRRYFPETDEKLDFPGEEEDARMYRVAVGYLGKNGYNRYEISNFAVKGRECQHNLTYWENKDYLGLGISAHSCIEGSRHANTGVLADYLASPTKSIIERWQATPLSRRQEKIFLGLRLSSGVETEFFSGYEKDVRELLLDGLIEEKNNRYRLTEQGVLLGNHVFSRFV